jgi:hypothetical protein
MPGRPDFSQPGSRGSGQTVAVSNRPKITKVEQTGTATVGSGNNEIIELYAPSDAIYRAINMRLELGRGEAPSTPTAGTHEFDVLPAALSASEIMKGSSTYDTGLRWKYSMWDLANDAKRPVNGGAAFNAMKSLVATEDQPIQIYYKNHTDASISLDREYYFVFEEQSY